jgi:hypothetical protein
MSYLKRITSRRPPQSRPLAGQVANSACGYAWAVDDWTRLRRVPPQPGLKLRIADCVNVTNLEFDVGSAELRENSLFKIKHPAKRSAPLPRRPRCGGRALRAARAPALTREGTVEMSYLKRITTRRPTQSVRILGRPRSQTAPVATPVTPISVVICLGNTERVHYPHRGIDWDDVGLGTEPDTVIAAKLGVASQVVQKARVRRSITRFYSREALQSASVDWETAGLGSRPDRVIAREVGVSPRKVCAERLKRKIPPFVGLVLNQEGSACRSIYEAMYDAWLHDQDICHEHEVRVPGTRFVADFLVEKAFVEVVGMVDFSRYRVKYERKRRAYAKAGINVRWLSGPGVERIYANCSLPLRFRNERHCLDCGKATHDLVKAVCRGCYMKRWHLADARSRTCGHCGRQFNSRKQSFCSLPCYWASLQLDWPRWEELDRLLAEKSIRQVALGLGVRPSTLYMRLRRRRLRTTAD